MLLTRGFALSRSWRIAHRRNATTAACLRDRVDTAGRAIVAKQLHSTAAATLSMPPAWCRDELGQVAARRRVRCLTSEGQVGEEVAHRAARSAPGSPWAAGSVHDANARAGRPGVVPERWGRTW